jgi:hypothetical protein
MNKKKLALKIINKLPIPKAQKDDVRKGVLEQLEQIENIKSQSLD